MGNIHGRTESVNSSAEALLIGSHMVISRTSLIYLSTRNVKCDSVYIFA